MFKNRQDAGTLLGRHLADKRTWVRPLVLALPRGGVPVGREVADTLDAELDVIVTRKIGAPHNPELAIGAVGPDGAYQVDERIMAALGITNEYVEQEAAREGREIRRRLEAYRSHRENPDVLGRDVILVDDGVATGHTIVTAASLLRPMGPKSITIAVPVCPRDVLPRLWATADDVACLSTPPWFEAVGQFYRDFAQVSDEQVVAALRKEERSGSSE